jgi:hypothetical protein
MVPPLFFACDVTLPRLLAVKGQWGQWDQCPASDTTTVSYFCGEVSLTTLPWRRRLPTRRLSRSPSPTG